VVEVAVRWSSELEGAETDVIQSLVVNTVSLVSVLNQLVNGQCGVVRLHDCV